MDKLVKKLMSNPGFSPGTPASFTTKTGCHDIAESGIKHQQFKIQIIQWISV